MKDNNVPNKKNEKKGGLFGFLNGGASQAGSITPGVIGGTASQASGGLLSLLTGKLVSTLVTVAILGGAGMVYIAGNSNMGGDSPDSEMMMASAQEAANYVPAIQRSEEANEGKSSIAMFNETNKGAVKFDIDPTLNNKNGQNADGAEGIDGADGEGYDADGLTDSGAAEMAEGAMASAAEAASLNNSNLSTSFGNDKSSKSLNMGGNNKPRLKTTFKPMANLKPVTKFKNNKALAYAKGKQAKKVSANRVGSRGGSRALNQARAMNNMLRNAATTSNFTTSRSMADAAWEGTTGDGESTETLDAGGLGEGEGMTVAPLSMGSLNDNTSKYDGNNGGWGIDVDNNNKIDVTPWQSELTALQICITVAMGLLTAAALLWDAAKAAMPWGSVLAAVVSCMLIAAAACAAAAVALSIVLMTKYGQEALGGMWLALSGASFLVCLAAVWGGLGCLQCGVQTWLFEHMTAVCGIGALLAGVGTSLCGSFGEKTADYDDARAYCEKNPDHDGCVSMSNTNTSKANTLYELADTPINNVLLS